MAPPPVVTVKRGRIKPLVYRHPWVFSASIDRVEGDPADGDVVEVRDPSGRFLASGFWSGKSQIRVRLFAWEPGVEPDLDFLRARVRAAAEFRRDWLGLPSAETTAFRVVHSEGDALPGLIVDRYGDALAIQVCTAGIERRRAALIDALVAELAPRAIVELDDDEARRKEGLGPVDPIQWGAAPKAPVEALERGLSFEVDLSAGQKTGFFADQRENRAAAAALARGRRVFDGFSYTGAFAIACARAGAAEALAVESSPRAVEAARRNVERNGVADRVEVLQADVYKVLGEARRAGRTWDLVILDPPKYAVSRPALPAALQKYKELVALGLRATAPGGVLVACTCSGLIDEPMFDAVLREAALEARRDFRVFRRGGQAPDHPVAIGCPESRYLQAVFGHVV